jgi:hypothetical protein
MYLRHEWVYKTVFDVAGALRGRMDAGCYVPNNPAHFGLEAWPAEAANHATSGSDMATFGLPPLDLEPLPSLFPFSPGASYK